MNFTPIDTSNLLPPQVPHALRLLNSIYLNGIASDLSETGVGKTYVASWVAKWFNAPVVVICPKSVKPEWIKVLAKFGVKAEIIINYEKLMRGNTPYVKFREPAIDPNTGKKKDEARCHLVTVNLPAGCIVILDESHKCKAPTSLNAGLLIALKRQGYKVLTLSASQATNPLEMRAYGFATNLHNLYNWKSWCLEHGADTLGRADRDVLTFDNDDLKARQKMSLAHNSLFNIQEIASRLTREEMGGYFPDNHVDAQAFDLGENSSAIQSVYDEMEDEIARLDEQTENYSGHVFAEIMKARRRAEMLKIPLFHEKVEDLFDEGKSVVVFLNFNESIEALSDRLNKNKKFHGKIGFIHGGQTDKERWKTIEDFQSDKLRILICNLKAGGVAISLHDLLGNHPRVSLISPSFSAIDMLQALGRIFRQGGKTKCYQLILFAAGCIEEKACKRVQSRLSNLSCLVDGDLTAGFQIF